MTNCRAAQQKNTAARRSRRPVITAVGTAWLLLGQGDPGRAATLPIPCAAGSCAGVTGPQTWVTSGNAQLVQAGGLMTITQGSENVILNWQSFNISKDGTVTFKQPDATAVALNQIFQADPSKILGALNANGSIYLINQNGIIFGAGAQVNTGGLIASSLNITPSALNGILNAGLNNSPAFAVFVDANGNPLPSGSIQVAAGASLKAPGGEIMLFGPQVTNQGSLSADGGQVIIAAGDSVYLAASTDPNLRGLLVEVGHGGTATNAAASTVGGTDYGQISAADGNVTMVGRIVNQLGRISASTAVQQNGSIYLLAQDGGGVSATAGATVAALTPPTNGGTLVLGAGSHTDVNLDLASTAAAVDATAQPKSQVVLGGQSVTLLGGSEVTATSGNVSINAQAQPGLPTDSYAAQPGAGRLVIDGGASIDVSGANIDLPMSSNVIPVQLRGTELANSPLQRSGPLYGQTVYVDTRQSGVLNGVAWTGSPIGDLSGYLSAIQRTVGQRNLSGGTISLNSDGAVFVAAGATLNISGGSIDYQPGYINTTKLLGTNGLVYDISQANPNQTYAGIVSNYSLTDPKWGITQNFPIPGSANPQGQFEAGYVEGKDAGSVTIVAPRLVLDGNITANTVAGPFQRNLPAALDPTTNAILYRPFNQMPESGQLILGLADGGGPGVNNYLLPDVVFAPGTVLDTLLGPTGAPFNPLTDPLPAALDTVQIRPNLFGPGGIGQLALYANGTVSIPANVALKLPADGLFSITAGGIDLAGTITSHNGAVSLTATTTESIQGGDPRSALVIGPEGQIDVSGEWINDQPSPTAPTGTDPLAIGGGSVRIGAGGGASLDLQAGSVIDVSGGAQRTASGKIVDGAGGAISISVAPPNIATESGVPVTLGSTLLGYGLAQGGKLSLTANAICIAAADCTDGQVGELWVPTALFSADGFGSLAVSSNFGGLAVAAGTQLAPRLLNYGFTGDPSTAPTGTPLSVLAAPIELADQNRAPVNLSLAVNASPPPAITSFDNATYATAGILTVGAGANIALDPRANLSLSSDTSIVIDGGLSAPGGNLSIQTTTTLPITEFISSQGIWLEAGAQLSTRGIAQVQVSDSGYRTGTVLNGGNISIAANRGYLITAPGSSLDASGVATTLNLGQDVSVGGTISPVPSLVGSNGGTITLSAAEGLLLNGAVTARAGAAPGAAGGTLDITLDGNLHGPEPGGSGSAPIFPFSPRQIDLTDGAPVVVAPDYAVPSQFNGIALVPTAMIEAGGFSALQLNAKNLFDAGGPSGGSVPVSTGSIVFEQDTNLQLPASIRLDAPQISVLAGAQVQLQAPYVALGYDDTQSGAQTGYGISAGAGTSNAGSLQVHANLIDIIGSLGLGGVSSTTFDSAGDIRFSGIESSASTPLPIQGNLVTQGTLVLQADQIYPTTLSQYTVTVEGAANGVPNTLEILPGASAGGPVLSAGGQLNLIADVIQQGGVLRAPFGQIVLGAPSGNTQITLEPGSITSTSGAGLTIPFGSTQAGTDWVYALPEGQFAVYTQSGPPAKSVQINGNSIVVDKGATIDLSGGGDLQASEFVPGVGGTIDVLSNTNSQNPGQFAIVPALSLQYAPFDPQLSAGFAYAPGSSVVLAGGGGVAAGTYAILPAAYALLPGAFLVRPVSGFSGITAGQSFGQTDGSTIIAGRFAVAGTGIISGTTSGFDIRPGTAVQQLGQYNLTSANSFFAQLAAANDTAAPALPMDAGQLQFSAGQQLAFLGDLAVAAAPGGRGAQVDISANQIDITNGGTAAPGAVALQAAQLNALGAQSLLIGGTRTANGNATDVTTTASTVTVDPGVTLSGSEILLTAGTALTVSQGATLQAAGAAIAVPGEYDLNGNGAFLRVSTGVQAAVVRTNPNADPTLGALTIDSGAILKSSGSASLEASGNFQSQATYQLTGGSLSFNASQISLGAAPSGTPGLVLTPAQLSGLSLDELDLTSSSSIGIYGANSLVVAGNVTLDAAAITASTADAAANLQAKQITLQNGSATAPAAIVAASAPASTGSLTLQADQLILGGGAVGITGFTAVALNGAAGIRAAASGSLATDAPLTLGTGQLSSANGVNYQIGSVGAPLQVLAAVVPAQSKPATPGAAGALSLSGTAVTIDTAISLPSGNLQVAATGSGPADNVALGSAASIDVSGIATTFDSVTVAAPGGRVSLSAASGGVTMAAGASVNVSSANPGAAAGALSIVAPNGMADLQASLTATGGSGASAGEFLLDVAQLPDLGALNATLNAGGFGGLRSFTQHGPGDLTLAAGATIRAATVSISNDGGSVNVAGSIDASGASGGSVALSAQNAIEIAGSINVSASASGQPGGSVELSSTAGLVHIDNSATLDFAGGAGASGGSLSLTVPRASLTGLLATPTSNPPAIVLGGNIEGAPQVLVEGLATYDAANDAVPNAISAADIAPGAAWYTDASTFMANAAAISAALTGSTTLNVTVVPGIQIQSTADLTLATNWDLSTWRFNGGPGILTLRAAGNLLIDDSLSDGFNGVSGAGAFLLPGVPDRSWSYRLVAGADLGASNLMAVVPSSSLPAGSGNVELAAGLLDRGTQRPPVPVMVRTGTGDIEIAAANDLQFGNRASVIYTAGQDSGAGVPLQELSDLAYPTAGGNINVSVGGDIIGAPTNQLVNTWLWRAGQLPGVGSALSAAGWTVNYQWFEENIGALAGGDVSINAGGNISQLSVAIPTIGRQVGGTGIAQSVVQVTGGGSLNVQSGGNITGGSYYVEQGTAVITAGGYLGADPSGAANTTTLAPVLALGDATIDVSARTGLTIEGVVNPFLLPQGIVQGANARTRSYFSTYTDSSAVSLESTAGDVTLLAQPAVDGLPVQFNSLRFSTGVDSEPFNLFPGTVSASALTGNLNVDGAITLWPAPLGNLNLFAAQNVVFSQAGGVLMSGLNPATLLNPEAPVQSLNQQFGELLAPPTAGASYAPIHSGAFTPNGGEDPNPVRVVALDGSITSATFSFVPKQIHLIAGQDITDLTLGVENVADGDLSIISAGRDITYASPRDVNGILRPESQSIVVSGPGSLLVEAGRDINLGTSTGITTDGNIDNPALPSGGASVSIVTGALVSEADLKDFITRYLTDSSTYDSLLIGFVQAYSATTVASKADALPVFEALSPEQQFLLCQQILDDEIRAGGRAAAAPGPQHGDYSRSFLALSTLFPNSTTASGANAATAVYPGSLSLYFSQIYTLDGGDISLLTPGGGVNVGLSTPPLAFGITKMPSQLGIVAQSFGDINSVSYGNFLVNQSRVFAADGGNILVWSTDGNVDAGRGAKTAISAPAPTITINAQGQIQTTFPAALEGSGIQALATTAGVTPGDVDLYAPQGVVNASDAGIVAGNLTIGATAVLGRNNITVSGVSVGVPVDSSGLGASLAGSSSVSSSASNAAAMAADVGGKTASATPLASNALGFLDVFVLGLGEDTCKQDDIDCLKRQKAN